MTVYKLKLLIIDDDNNVEGFRDLWLNVEKIDGFFIGNNIDGSESINILYGSDFMTVAQEDKIIDYLSKKFLLK